MAERINPGEEVVAILVIKRKNNGQKRNFETSMKIILGDMGIDENKSRIIICNRPVAIIAAKEIIQFRLNSYLRPALV